jgi:hypothetical protein
VNAFGAFWNRNRNHLCMVCVFEVLRPLVTGLVIMASVLLVLNCLWGDSFREVIQRLPNMAGASIVLASFLLTAFSKVSPVYVLLGGAGVGWVLHFVSIPL